MVYKRLIPARTGPEPYTLYRGACPSPTAPTNRALVKKRIFLQPQLKTLPRPQREVRVGSLEACGKLYEDYGGVIVAYISDLVKP